MKNKNSLVRNLVFISAVAMFPSVSFAAGEDNAGLAKKLANPVSPVISVPLQFSYDDKIGPLEEGHVATLKFQPVVPIPVNEGLNVISRTIVPFNWQNQFAPGAKTNFGMGDITQSFFFAPKTQGLIWGIGPEILLPTATKKSMGSEKWGIGPTAVVVKQNGPWTVGFLTGQTWSFAGKEDRQDINQTLVQPFITYTTPEAWGFNLQSETTYNWKEAEASVPLNFTVSKLVKFGKLPVSFSAGAGYWIDSPEDAGPKGWRMKAGITFMIPE